MAIQRIPLGAFSSAASGGIGKMGKVAPAAIGGKALPKMSPRVDALKKKAGGFIKSSSNPVSC